MTGTGQGPTRTFVWDASALHHPGKAGRLDTLGSYVAGSPALPWRHLTTDIVANELATYGIQPPAWCTVVVLSELAEVTAFASWVQVLATNGRNLGESSVAAWAQVHGDVAIIDDDPAKRVVARHGINVHGSIWLLCQAIDEGVVDATSVSSYFDECKATGAYLPFDRFGFKAWAVKKRLLRSDQV